MGKVVYGRDAKLFINGKEITGFIGDITIDEERAQQMMDEYHNIYPRLLELKGRLTNYGEMELRVMARKVWIDELKKNNRRNKRMRRHQS